MIKFSLFTIIGVLSGLILQAQEITLQGQALFGTMRARQIGPATMSGRISDIVAVEEHPEIIYVGTAGGGVWKSISAGGIFSPIFDDYTQSIGKIAIDQQHPDTLWVGTGETWVRNSVSVGTGIYKSVDGGTTWELKGLENSERISDILIHPEDPDIVYVGVMGHLWNANEERGVYKTTDGGENWEKILYVDENSGCADMDMDPQNHEILYASMWDFRREPDFFRSGGKGSGLYKSTDGGKTWGQIHQGLPDTILGRMALAVAPSNGNTIYLTVEVKEKDKKGLYVSNDAGESWKKINNEFNTTVRPFYFSNLVVDPKNDSVVYKCGLNLIVSNDMGESFRTVGSGVHSDIHAVWIDPNQTKHILIGTDGGVYESLDGGYLFKMFMNLPVSQFYHVSVDMDKPYHVYGGLQDNGSWYAPSQKAGGIQNSDWKLTFGGDGFYSFKHPVDKDIIYCEYQGGEIVRYNKSTGQAKDIKPYPDAGEDDFRFNWNAPVHLSATNPERMYFGAQYLFMTEDRGDTWERISPDLTTNDPQRQRQKQSGGLSIDNSTAENNTTIYTIAESPKDENVIWVGTDDGNLQVTVDGGITWTNVVDNIQGLPPKTWVTFVEPGHHQRDRLYVTFDGHRTGDMAPYIYRTDDLGKTWTDLKSPEMEGYCLSVREDLQNPDLLFLGTEFGLYISVNGGNSWSRFKNNLPKVGIRDMVIHPRDHALVMATHGRGVIIIDDITPLRQITADIVDKNVHFFETAPAVIRDPGSGNSWFSGAGNFTGPNPPETARIVYYMNKRHTFGKMYLEIYDDEDNLIREYPAGKSAGINIVEIPIRSEKPKSAPTNNRMALFGSLFGPSLPQGEYKVKLIKGKDSFETKFELVYDPGSPYTVDDRILQDTYVRKLFRMSEDLAFIYYATEEMKNQARSKNTESKKIIRELTEFSNRVEKFNTKLVALEGDMYVDEEEKIRERISNLYRQISSYPGRPSNSQMDRTEVLEDEMNKIEAEFINIQNEELLKINRLLEKQGLEPINYQTKEIFLSQ